MAKSLSSPPSARPLSRRDGNHRATTSTKTDGDGNRIQNEILLALPRAECDAIFPKLEFVRMKLHQVLHEAGETLRSAYFCNSGMFSILNVMPDGKASRSVWSARKAFRASP